MRFFEYDIDKLGFGCMRLPVIEGTTIDIEKTKDLVDAFMAAGFSYFDTAWAYDGSEDALRQALVERYPRDDFQIATKICPWLKCESAQDLEAQFHESLETLGVDYVDFLMVHNIGAGRTDAAEKHQAWEVAKRFKEQGKARHIGFSTHGTPDEVRAYLDVHSGVEFVQMQLNYSDWEDPAYKAREVYKAIRERDLPVVVMGPVKGGLLADPPAVAKEAFAAVDPDCSPAAWALRFAADHEGIMAVLSGMITMDDMRDNIAALQGFAGLAEDEIRAVDAAREAIAEAGLVQCTACEYCVKVCPCNVDIPTDLSALNYLIVSGDAKVACRMLTQQTFFTQRAHPAACTQCGACEAVCPQGISIREHLRRCTQEILPRAKELEPVRMRK